MQHVHVNSCLGRHRLMHDCNVDQTPCSRASWRLEHVRIVPHHPHVAVVHKLDVVPGHETRSERPQGAVPVLQRVPVGGTGHGHGAEQDKIAAGVLAGFGDCGADPHGHGARPERPCPEQAHVTLGANADTLVRQHWRRLSREHLVGGVRVPVSTTSGATRRLRPATLYLDFTHPDRGIHDEDTFRLDPYVAHGGKPAAVKLGDVAGRGAACALARARVQRRSRRGCSGIGEGRRLQ